MTNTVRQKEAAAFVRDLMDRRMTPRNQVASLSGLSNTYIRHLEGGRIANVSRDKLIAFGVALSLNLNEIDTLLTVFDRSQLTLADIPLFLETGGQRKISGAMMPLHDLYTYELYIMMAERIPGDLVIVNDAPTANLQPPGFRTYADRLLIDSHPLYQNLIEAVGKERRGNLTNKLIDYRLDHYICRSCLDDYIRKVSEPVTKMWRRKHLEQTIWYVENFDNFRLHLSNSCSRFNFTLKTPVPDLEEAEKLLFLGKAPHAAERDGFDHLSGFATENQVVIANFKEGLAAIEKKVIVELEDRSAMVRHLKNLMDS